MRAIEQSGKRRRRRRRGRVAVVAVGTASVLGLSGLVQPAAAHHRRTYVSVTQRCSDYTQVAGTTLLRLGSLVVGSVEQFRSNCGMSRSHFQLNQAFEDWAYLNGYQWFASTVVYSRSFGFGSTPFGDPFRGHSYAFGTEELWSSPVVVDGYGCTAAMGSLILYRGDQYLPVNHALTSVICA
ncbi:MAG: hypothetical protein ACRD1K_03040 [Acidimicrobiales bacterium]